jgi:hypothetical protein
MMRPPGRPLRFQRQDKRFIAPLPAPATPRPAPVPQHHLPNGSVFHVADGFAPSSLRRGRPERPHPKFPGAKTAPGNFVHFMKSAKSVRDSKKIVDRC